MKILLLGRDLTFGINGSFGLPEKKFSVTLVKQTQNFARVSIIMLITVICLLMTLKPTIKVLTFQLNFVSEIYFILDIHN